MATNIFESFDDRRGEMVNSNGESRERAVPIDLLVVDDDDRLRGSIVEYLLGRGMRVVDASDGRRAWDLAMRRTFDVVTLEPALPGLCGLELLEKFRRGGVECEVIVLTGRASVASAVGAMKLGAFDYLTKPVPLPDLKSAIQKAARHHRQAKENRQLALPPEIAGETMREALPICATTDKLAVIERAKLLEVLRRERGNKSRAARALGVERRKLYRLLDKHDVQAREFSENSS